MNLQDINQYVVGIFADYQAVGITVIGTNKNINKYWVFEHIYHPYATIDGIKQSLDDLFLRIPEIRKIHVNNIEELRKELSDCYQKKLFVGESLKSEGVSNRPEIPSEIQVIEFEVEEVAFILNSYINDSRLVFKESLLQKKSNLKTQIEHFNLTERNQSVFSLFIAISSIEPIKYSDIFMFSLNTGQTKKTPYF